MRQGLLLILLGLWGTGWTQALPEPVDPLERAALTPGHFTLSAAFGYAPDARVAFGVDEGRGPYTDHRTAYNLNASVGLGYAVSEALSLGAGVTYALTHTQTLRAYSDTALEFLEESAHEASPRVTLAYRLAPDHPLDPAFSASLAYPWTAFASLSGSVLRDPTVLSAALEYTQRLQSPYARAVGVSLGAGFVANDRVSYSFSASYEQPLAFAAVPRFGTAFTTAFSLDAASKRTVSVTFQAAFQGGEARLGVALGYEARDVLLRAFSKQ